MSEERIDVAVVGGGAMGAASAWHLARAGRGVTVFEQFEPGHRRGASHGASRNFNVAYTEPDYLAWLREARTLWAELEAESATTFLTRTGIVNHGPGRDYVRAAEAISAGGFSADVIDARAAAARWPGFRFETPVLYTPDAGRLHADAAVTALLSTAAARGAEVAHHSAVRGLELLGHDDVRLTVDSGDGPRTVRARRVIVTAGAWTGKLLGATPGVSLPTLRVTQEQPAHFAPRDADAPWPGFNHAPDAGDPETAWFPTAVYGMLTPGEGVKAGWHAAGPVVDPDRRSFQPDPQLTAAIVRYARDWLPGVDSAHFTEVTCTYTSTPDSRFTLERFGPIVVGAGFSGHGFKFTPVVGRILAGLAA